MLWEMHTTIIFASEPLQQRISCVNLLSQDLCSVLSPPGVPLYLVWLCSCLLFQHITLLGCQVLSVPHLLLWFPSCKAFASPSLGMTQGCEAGSLCLPAALHKAGNDYLCLLTIDALVWKGPNSLYFLFC